jgi:hypothetical protein
MNMNAMAMDDENKEMPRVTNQCRARGGMEYDLKCEGARLTLLVSARSQEADSGDWRVQARPRGTSFASGGPVVTGWGRTRGEALRAVGRSWTSSSPEHGLPAFDWDGVANALAAVRAL